MRKPDLQVFNYILHENKLKTNETLFIDDRTENTDSAKKLGISIWRLDPLNEDVVDLFDKMPLLRMK